MEEEEAGRIMRRRKHGGEENIIEEWRDRWRSPIWPCTA
jgi:hypothetical protein